MTTNRDFERITSSWLAAGPTELNDRVLEAALDEVHLTQQRRRWSAPWRFTNMPMFTRATASAAVLLIAAVGVGGAVYFTSSPGGSGSVPTPTPASTPAETRSPTVSAWKTYESTVYPTLTLSYPADWSVNAQATRTWQPGDRFGDDAPYADSFASPDEATIGLFVWEMLGGEGADLYSVEGLKAWADGFCTDVGMSSCAEFTRGAVPMCLGGGGGACPAAILVPTADQQFAFFPDWSSLMFTNAPDRVTVVLVAREDGFPSATRYGGSVELLKAILEKMRVRTPTPGQVVGDPPR